MAPSLEASVFDADADKKDRNDSDTRAGRHVITDTPTHPTRSLQFLNNLKGKKESKAVGVSAGVDKTIGKGKPAKK